MGPVLEVTTSYLQGKYGVETRIESVNKDNSHSWVRISHGLNKLVTDLNDNKEDDDNEQEKIIHFLMDSYWSKIVIFVKLMRKASVKWRIWSDFKAQHSTQFRGKKWGEDRDTILELTGNIQELQNEINCMNDSRDFQDAESVSSGHSLVASQPVSFRPHPVPGWMLSRSLGLPSRSDGQPSILDTHGISGNVFANPTASSSAPYPQELNPWSSIISEHTSPHVMSENQTPLRIRDASQSWPSARNSVLPSEGDFSKKYGADQQRLQISDPHFDKFPTPPTFACWIQDWGMYLFTISYGSYAVDQRSGDGWFSGRIKIFVIYSWYSSVLVFSSVEIWWNVGSKYGETSK